jgi:hypothetical protein
LTSSDGSAMAQPAIEGSNRPSAPWHESHGAVGFGPDQG